MCSVHTFCRKHRSNSLSLSDYWILYRIILLLCTISLYRKSIKHLWAIQYSVWWFDFIMHSLLLKMLSIMFTNWKQCDSTKTYSLTLSSRVTLCSVFECDRNRNRNSIHVLMRKHVFKIFSKSWSQRLTFSRIYFLNTNTDCWVMNKCLYFNRFYNNNNNNNNNISETLKKS